MTRPMCILYRIFYFHRRVSAPMTACTGTATNATAVVVDQATKVKMRKRRKDKQHQEEETNARRKRIQDDVEEDETEDDETGLASLSAECKEEIIVLYESLTLSLTSKKNFCTFINSLGT